jgi:hypothetical protein
MAHGVKNIKTINVQQENTVNIYRNIKFKLLRNNASIWFNKQCEAHQLMPAYARNNQKQFSIYLTISVSNWLQ